MRAFDAALGSWTTPDAYAGDVHDPASQQRYMWNRNNPYEYSDPSGYCIGPWDLWPPAAAACAVMLAVGAAATRNGPAITAEINAPGSGAGVGAAGRVAMSAARGAAAEAVIRNTIGWQKASLTTSLGNRLVDGFDPVSGTLNEIKVGLQGTDSRIMSEVAKDAELVKGGASVTWHFFDSVLTGAAGPTAELRKALVAAGIKIEQHNIAF